jgi:hypothetical protein
MWYALDAEYAFFAVLFLGARLLQMFVCWFACLDATVAMVGNVAAHCPVTIITFVTNVQTFLWVPRLPVSIGCCVYAPHVFRPADFSCLVFL